MKKNLYRPFLAVNLSLALAAAPCVLPLSPATTLYAQEARSTMKRFFSFDDGISGWTYGTGWEWNYQGGARSCVLAENGRLKAICDFEQDADADWSNLAICYQDPDGMDLTDVDKLSLDVYFETSKLTSGTLKIGIYSNSGIDTFTDLSSIATPVDGTDLSKATLTFQFSALSNTPVHDLAIKIIGSHTDYHGAIYFDDLTLSADTKVPAGPARSTVALREKSPVTYKDHSLQFETGRSELASEISLVDPQAAPCVLSTYLYLQGVGRSDQVIFGHQDDTWQKAGSASLSESDVKDVTGSIAGIVGVDALSLTGSEYSASRYNKEHGTSLPETSVGNVMAAAALTNEAIEQGAIITLSAHMPNFANVKKIDTTDTSHRYSGYDFSGYTVSDMRGDVMNNLLPGGTCHDAYTAYLDMIADYASQVDGTILFRPFHENTGSWFWWGASSCDPTTYKNVFRYTVTYLRDVKQLHNLIYVYGPGSEAETVTDYETRYPGDAYVDMVGFDMYDRDPVADNEGYHFLQDFEHELSIVDTFAKEHNKLIAVTECGVATSHADPGHNQTALHPFGNRQLEWFLRMTDIIGRSNASFFLVWANFGKADGYYTPFVDQISEDGTLIGHELLDPFRRFYNDPRSIFAKEQKQVLQDLAGQPLADLTTIHPAQSDLSAFFTAPVSGTRLTDGCTLQVALNGPVSGNATFVIHGQKDLTIPATCALDHASAVLDTALLKEAGATADGSISFCIDGVTYAQIFVTLNMKEPVDVPSLVDDFDQYYGYDSQLLKRWSTNHASQNQIDLHLNSDASRSASGSSLALHYQEKKEGWAGATIAKTADWSSYNALSFYTIPDQNQQKYVVQITANNTIYEVYLNDYADYQNATGPIRVTIPFSAFCERDAIGHPTGRLCEDANAISSFGLWVNAIDTKGEWKDGTIQGTLYYDDIKAIRSDATDVTFQKLSQQAPDEQTHKFKKCQITGVKDLYRKVYPGGSFTLHPKVKSKGKLHYKSSDRTVATVSPNGKISLHGIGTAKITITADARNGYQKSTRTLKLKVEPKKVCNCSVKKHTAFVFHWKSVPNVDGYEIEYSTKASFAPFVKKKVSNKATSYTLKGLKKKKHYYIRIRGHKKIGHTTYYGSYSSVLSFDTL